MTSYANPATDLRMSKQKPKKEAAKAKPRQPGIDEDFKIEIIPADEWQSDADDFEIDEVREKIWAGRNWRKWLMESLSFPFKAVRDDGDDGDLFGSDEDERRFMVGINVDVLGLDAAEGRWGIEATVRHGKQSGNVPLADLSVRPKSDPNFKIVLEYSIAVANDYVDLEVRM